MATNVPNTLLRWAFNNGGAYLATEDAFEVGPTVHIQMGIRGGGNRTQNLSILDA